jgi:hypothetical protein
VALYKMGSKSGECVTIFLVCNLHMWQYPIECCKRCVLQIVCIQGFLFIIYSLKKKKKNWDMPDTKRKFSGLKRVDPIKIRTR